MSFYDENILFIKSKLVCELNKTKNEADKYEKYIANFKDETRNRLLKSYTSSVVKGKFYLEISKYLYDVEADYILLNLYFEQNFHNLLNILISKHAFKKVLKNCHSNIVNTLYNNRLFRNATIRNHKEIIKEQFNLLINIPKGPYNRNPYKEFINVEENNFDLIYSYSWWIINRISQEKVPETTIISFLLFTKLWNIFPEFHSIKPNMIAISLLNKINNDFKLKVDELCVPKLYEFNNLTSNIFDSLFVNTKMASPITLDYDYSYYTKGYYKQKEIYLKNIQLSKDLVVDYTKSSYPEVLKLIISEPDEMLKKIYLSNWFNKFQGDKYPSEEDILKINNLVNEENKSIVRKFYEKYYVYELI